MESEAKSLCEGCSNLVGVTVKSSKGKKYSCSQGAMNSVQYNSGPCQYPSSELLKIIECTHFTPKEEKE